MTNKLVQTAKDVIMQEAEGLRLLAENINEQYLRAIELLASTKGRVVVSGIGKSGIIAKKITATLASTGTHSFFIHPAEASHGDLGMVHSDDALIILSNGGESLEIFDLVDYAKDNKIPIIAIVGRASSSLAKEATIILELPKVPEASHINAPTTSTTMMLALGDALAVGLIERKGFSAAQYKKLHPGGRLGAQMLTVKEVMRTGVKLPIIHLNTKTTDALVEITSKAMGCAVVLDQTNKIVGIITDGDLRRHINSDFLNMNISDIMTNSPLLIDQEMKVIEALEIMNKKSITSLIVAQNGDLAGIIHIHDCLRIGLDAIHDDKE